MKSPEQVPMPIKMGGWLQSAFQRFARRSVRASGHPFAFGIALSVILLWLMMGPWFHFGNTWLLFIDTVGNIITFLMIFLIHNAHNRESEAVQLKLDELIRATKSAHNSLLDIEELSEEELDRIKARFERLARTARAESAGSAPAVPPPVDARTAVTSDTASGSPAA